MLPAPIAFSPATTLAEAFNAVNPDVVLQPGDPRYVDFNEWRGEERAAHRIAKQIGFSNQASPVDFVKQIFAGHRGSGKSTELQRLKAKLEDEGFFVAYLDSALAVDMNDVSYADVLLATMYGLVDAVETSGLGILLSEGSVDGLRRRLATATVERTTTVAGDAKVEASAEVGGGIAGFLKVLARSTASLKGSKEQKEQLRHVIEPQIGLFLEDLNDLINGLQNQLRDRGRKGLVIIVDSLDRIVLNALPGGYGRTTHSEVFIEHAEHLKAPRCHMVYTVPISLYFDQNLTSSYSAQPVLLPMIKIRDRDGTWCEPALAKMQEAVAQRMDVEMLFEDPRDVRRLCVASGGHLRDLMLLLRMACINSDERITPRAVNQAISSLTTQYDRLVKDADLSKLVEVHRERRLPTDAEYAHLPYHLLVLEYRNGEPWADVHPAVMETRKFREALAAAQAPAPGDA